MAFHRHTSLLAATGSSAGHVHARAGDDEDDVKSRCCSTHCHQHRDPNDSTHHAGWRTHQQQAPSYSLIVSDTKAQKKIEMYLQPDIHRHVSHHSDGYILQVTQLRHVTHRIQLTPAQIVAVFA